MLFLFAASFRLENAHGASVPDDACTMCHGRQGIRAPFVDLEAAKNSVHGRNGCISCHRDADSVPHSKDLEAVDCVMEEQWQLTNPVMEMMEQ